MPVRKAEAGPRLRPVWDTVATRVETLLAESAKWTGGKHGHAATPAGHHSHAQHNLVINTAADQIILAEVGTASAGGLPPVRYKSAGLDEGAKRTLVCSILEGSELAFRDRARRLRIGWKR